MRCPRTGTACFEGAGVVRRYVIANRVAFTDLTRNVLRQVFDGTGSDEHGRSLAILL